MKARVMGMMTRVIDAHGCVDICGDGHGHYEDLIVEEPGVEVTTVQQTPPVVTGASLNGLLRSLCLLFGQSALTLRESQLYSALVDVVYCCLPALMDVSDIFIRLVSVHSSVCERLRSQDGQSSGPPSLPYLIIMAHGAVALLQFWIAQYSHFLSDEDLVKMHISSATATALYRSLTDKSATGQRLRLGAYQHDVEALQHSTERLAAAITRHLTQLTCGSDAMQAVVLSAQLPLVAGAWSPMTEGEKPVISEKTQQLKAALQETVQFKLEIFGGDAFLDNVSDDDDEDIAAMPSRQTQESTGPDGNDSGDVTPVHFVATMPRIPKGQSVLRCPLDDISQLWDLYSVDEVARQWTLDDAFLFHHLPLHSLTAQFLTNHYQRGPPRARNAARRSSSASNTHWSGTGTPSFRDLQQRAALSFAPLRGGWKRLVERFNCSSLWVIFSILSRPTVDERAQRIEWMVELGSCFQKLRNFHSLMMIVASLQQACISRLRKTWALVKEEAQIRFQELKEAMASERNYQRYQREVQQQVQERLRRIRASSLQETGEEDWRIHVKRRCPDFPLEDSRLSGGTSLGTASVVAGGGSAPASVAPLSVEDVLVVPHIGAHIATLTALSESSSDYLATQTHLFNIYKLRQIANILMLISAAQQCFSCLGGDMGQVRLVVADLHVSWRSWKLTTAQEQSDVMKKLFALSLQRESDRLDMDDEGTLVVASDASAERAETPASPLPLPPPPLKSPKSPKLLKSLTSRMHFFSGSSRRLAALEEHSGEDGEGQDKDEEKRDGILGQDSEEEKMEEEEEEERTENTRRKGKKKSRFGWLKSLSSRSGKSVKLTHDD